MTPNISKIWIGDRYAEGWTNNQRMLVLGESSYGGGENVSAELVKKYLAGSARNWGRTYTRFLSILRGTKPETSHWTRAECWSRLAFMNYIETSQVLGPGQMPLGDEWTSASDSLKDRLGEIEPPQVVILWGYRLWDHLVAVKKLMPSETWGRGALALTPEILVPCFKIQHPCRAMSHQKMTEWSKWLKDFL